MSGFSGDFCIANQDDDVREFIADELAQGQRVLFIGTVGLDSASRLYPQLLARAPNVQFRFFVELRPGDSSDLKALGQLHRSALATLLPAAQTQFIDVEVVSPDGATVAGRNAVTRAAAWFGDDYDAIVVDATGMSRGTCFPLVQQALQAALNSGADMHLLVASKDAKLLDIQSQSNDRADWMHGFQYDMETDRTIDALRLWIPQLAEGLGPALTLMQAHLQSVAEVCPILPFPAADPLRGDRLLSEHGRALKDEWESGAMNVIYAHESDPLDVFHTISKIHKARRRVFEGSASPAVTIVSPGGWRIGSLGMLLAAIELQLPMLYVETVGYTCASAVPSEVEDPAADHLWHLCLAGTPYENGIQHQEQ